MMDDMDEPATCFSDTVTLTTPMIAEKPDDHRQYAARGVFYWDASEPLEVGLQFELMINSIPITPEQFPTDGDARVVCLHCDEDLNYGEMGALVVEDAENPEQGTLWCLMCANDHPSTTMIESLWILGFEALEGALVNAEPADAGAAVARVWRADEHNFQIALREKTNLLILTLPISRLEQFFVAVRRYQAAHKTAEETYLDKALAELEKLANGQ